MPLGKLAALQEDCLIQAVSTLNSENPIPKYVILHAIPSDLCSHPAFTGSDCTQLQVESFSNYSDVPYRLPFVSASLDGLIYQGVFDNTLDVSRTVFEAKRVLKPKAIFTFDATHRSIFTWIHHTLQQRLFALSPTNLHNWRLFITPKEATRVLSAYEFSDISTSAYTTSVSIGDLVTGIGVLNSIKVSQAVDPSQHYCMRAERSISLSM